MRCPFCDSEDVEVVAPWGGQIITRQVRCRACKHLFLPSGPAPAPAPPRAPAVRAPVPVPGNPFDVQEPVRTPAARPAAPRPTRRAAKHIRLITTGEITAGET